MTLLFFIFWLIAGTDAILRINVDHSHVSLTGWGTAFLFAVAIDFIWSHKDSR